MASEPTLRPMRQKLSDEELAARIPDRSGEQQLRYAMAIILLKI